MPKTQLFFAHFTPERAFYESIFQRNVAGPLIDG
jgi:hypothetical protein